MIFKLNLKALFHTWISRQIIHWEISEGKQTPENLIPSLR